MPVSELTVNGNRRKHDALFVPGAGGFINACTSPPLPMSAVNGLPKPKPESPACQAESSYAGVVHALAGVLKVVVKSEALAATLAFPGAPSGRTICVTVEM